MGGRQADTLVLGFDPSTRGAAWALLSVSRPHRQLVRLGVAADDTGIRQAILEAHVHATLRSAPLRIAVECPGGLHIHGEGIAAARARATALMATSRVAGYIVATSHGFGLTVTELTPEQWRRGVVGKAQASDAAVKRAVLGLVEGWPGRSSSHVRDAAGAALGVAFQRNGES